MAHSAPGSIILTRPPGSLQELLDRGLPPLLYPHRLLKGRPEVGDGKFSPHASPLAGMDPNLYALVTRLRELVIEAGATEGEVTGRAADQSTAGGIGGCADNEEDIRRTLERNRERFPLPGGRTRSPGSLPRATAHGRLPKNADSLSQREEVFVFTCGPAVIRLRVPGSPNPEYQFRYD